MPKAKADKYKSAYEAGFDGKKRENKGAEGKFYALGQKHRAHFDYVRGLLQKPKAEEQAEEKEEVTE